MPFIAVCPFCRASKFRAPYRKRGRFVTCPRCGRDYMLIPEPAVYAPAVDYKLPPFEPDPPGETPTLTAVASAPTEPVVHEPAAEAPPAAPAAGTSPADRPEVPDPVPAPPGGTDYALRLALVALGLFGAAMVASQFPYGRFVAAPVAGLGVVLAGLGLLGLDVRRWLGWAGVGLNAFALLLVVALPGWLGVSSWTPAADPDAGPKPVTAVGRDGSLPRPADWVDARAAVWEHGDVRVAVTAVTVGRHDPAAKTAAGRKELSLRVGLKLTNVGVARAIEFPGWPAAPPGEPTLTTAGGKPLPVKPAAGPAGLSLILPGKSAEAVVAFAAPTGPAEDLRLELPAAAFGGTEPVRFHIPRTMIAPR